MSPNILSDKSTNKRRALGNVGKKKPPTATVKVGMSIKLSNALDSKQRPDLGWMSQPTWQKTANCRYCKLQRHHRRMIKLGNWYRLSRHGRPQCHSRQNTKRDIQYGRNLETISWLLGQWHREESGVHWDSRRCSSASVWISCQYGTCDTPEPCLASW